MPAWLTRTVLSGASVAANGTNAHTCTFTAATSGNTLIAVVNGAVTFTTPSGWTLVTSAVNNTGVYVFSKTASSGESSFSTTHNGSNYIIKGVVYEYYAGTTVQGQNSAIGQSATTTGPAVGSLTGTYSRFTARSWNIVSTIGSTSCAWTLPTVEDYDDSSPNNGSTDGVSLTIAYDDNSTGASFDPSSVISLVSTGGSSEDVSFALSVAVPTAPVVVTSPVTAITPTTATGNGSVISDGGSTITERGVCWGTSINPTTSDSKATSAGTTGSYNVSITSLTNNTRYHARAYAINGVGTTYGGNVSFISNGGTSAWFTA